MVERAKGKWVLNILGNAMFLHIASIAIEEHVIHMFLVLSLQLFLLNGEPHSELL